MRLMGESLHKSTRWAMNDLRAVGGDGGVIALDESGKGQFDHVLCFD